MSPPNFFKLDSPLLKVGENLSYIRKISLANIQTVLNFFFEKEGKNFGKRSIFFILIQASFQNFEKSSIFSYFLKSLITENDLNIFFNKNISDFLLLDKFLIKNQSLKTGLSFCNLIFFRILSRSFFFNFLLEFEFFFEENSAFSFFQFDLIQTFLKIFFFCIFFLDDQTQIEHCVSFIKTKIDFISDFFGFFQTKNKNKGNHLCCIDFISEIFGLFRLKIKHKTKITEEIKKKKFLTELRKTFPVKIGEEKIIFKKKKVLFRPDFFFLEQNLNFKKIKKFKKKQWLIQEYSSFFLFDYFGNKIDVLKNFNFFSKNNKKYWFRIFDKTCHFSNHFFLSILLCSHSTNKTKTSKFLSLFFDFFFSDTHSFFFCLGDFLEKILKISNFFSREFQQFFSDLITFSFNNQCLKINWKNLIKKNFNSSKFLFVSKISEKIKSLNSLIFGVIKIPKFFSKKKKVFFKKKTNYKYLKSINKLIFIEKNKLNDRKLTSQLFTIFNKIHLNGFSLFLFSSLIPELPVNSQIILFEKFEFFVRSLTNSNSKKLPGIRVFFILKSKFFFLNVQMLLEKLTSYQIIDIKFMGRGIFIDDFFEENNFFLLFDIIKLFSKILFKKRKSIISDKKFLKIFIQKISYEKKILTKKAYLNLKKAENFFISEIQSHQTSFLENINLGINKILNQKKKNFFFLDSFFQKIFFWNLLKFFIFSLKKLRKKKIFPFFCCIKTKKTECLYNLNEI
ncbi:hypothetical protein HAN_2g307 (nucleomorph) [Hemiselmis andersenii]|uniref:Uncharacterized protein n=1 Tax=Hemiselmis andersenii TaxID=464988 RepID=A9BKX1_HEMAN|nr:hypothetical protein HAN_2g307 [Hemiselmis andersenii]ABW98126.1 hypothetical protein HAN_2g307 [Hemiselmis andersenii]